MKRILLFASALLLAMADSASLAVFASAQAAALDTPVVIMGAGDIAQSGTSLMANATSTGDLIRAAAPNFAFTLGDNAYPDGSATDYTTKYSPTWGSFKSITKPVPGNHEYHANPPSGYLGYFGAANVTNTVDGGVYYAWNIGNGWRAYALNSEVDMRATSPQAMWLKNDLAANPDKHYIAMWHQPRFTSLGAHGPRTNEADIWNVLMAAGTDIIMEGHNHFYERFAKMSGNGTVDATGIRSFIVGSGGDETYQITSIANSSLFHNDVDYGVLKLTLHANSYDWEFVASGRGFQNGTHIDTGRRGAVLDSGTDATNKTVGPSPTSTTTTVTVTPTALPVPTDTPTPTITPTPAALDDFTCYKAGATSGSVKFAGISIPPVVTLVDQFGSSTVQVKKPNFLCAPTNKLSGDPTAPTHPEHLTGYPIKNLVKPVFRTKIKVVDQFNVSGLFVDARKQVHLFVPTAKNLSATPPTPAAFVTDHFECYKSTVTSGTPKFVAVPGVTLQDQFGSMTVTVKKPTFLCNPVDKNGEDPTAPTRPNHLICYQIKQTDPVKFAKRTELFVNNQFGPEALDAKKPALLCVPALTTP